MPIPRLPASLSSVSVTLAFALAAIALTGCGPEYPSCRNDGDCHDAEYCVDGQCQQCRSDSDCGAGSTCNRGACEASARAECSSDADCGDGRTCTGGRCVANASQDLGDTSGSTTNRCDAANVYFAYDESTLDRAARDAIGSNARCFEGSTDIVLTGMTDPRGTEEYNLTLGERRARAVSDYLRRLGVERDHVRIRSVGEEYATGDDESGYANDRRVESGSH